jgi:RNA polymerase sigma-70 factor, ECF subfamily
MALPSPEEVTRLLRAWNAGEETALEKLIPLVYAELRRVAHCYMRRERLGHSLQTTALVNEAYVQLVDARNVPWQARAHFFAISAQLMRRILVHWARSKNFVKRGGGAQRTCFDEALVVSNEQRQDVPALDEALTALATIDARKSKLVELRCFGALSVEEQPRC